MRKEKKGKKMESDHVLSDKGTYGARTSLSVTFRSS